jgi:hypothetical protein
VGIACAREEDLVFSVSSSLALYCWSRPSLGCSYCKPLDGVGGALGRHCRLSLGMQVAVSVALWFGRNRVGFTGRASRSVCVEAISLTRGQGEGGIVPRAQCHAQSCVAHGKCVCVCAREHGCMLWAHWAARSRRGGMATDGVGWVQGDGASWN